MKKIITTQDRVFIYLLQAKLTEQGINCFIKNENPPLAGEIPPALAWPELWIIDDECFTSAQQILEEALSAQKEPKENWICSQCGEKIEGQFELCWKCGANREISTPQNFPP